MEEDDLIPEKPSKAKVLLRWILVSLVLFIGSAFAVFYLGLGLITKSATARTAEIQALAAQNRAAAATQDSHPTHETADATNTPSADLLIVGRIVGDSLDGPTKALLKDLGTTHMTWLELEDKPTGLDSLTFFKALRLPLPPAEPLTEATAAAAIHEYLNSKYGALLQPYLEDVRRPKWVLQNQVPTGFADLMRMPKTLDLLVRCALVMGDPVKAEEYHEALRMTAKHLSHNRLLGGLVAVSNLRLQAAQMLLPGWSPEQMSKFRDDASACGLALQSAQSGLQAEEETLLGMIPSVRSLREQQRQYASRDTLREKLDHWIKSMIPDSAFVTFIKLGNAERDLLCSRITPQGRLLTPPTAWPVATPAKSKGLFGGIEHDLTSITSVSTYHRILLDVISAEDKLSLARITVALEIHKRKEGNYPATLQDLAPEFAQKAVPSSLFTNSSFLYMQTPEGFALWGVGKDLRDGGGDESVDDTWQKKPKPLRAKKPK